MKTKAQISFTVTVKLISAFVLATRIAQFLFFLIPKFQAPSQFVTVQVGLCLTWLETPTANIFTSLKIMLVGIMFSI